MRLTDRFSILRTISPSRRAVQQMAARWAAIAGREPELARDVIRLGGVLTLPPSRFEDGIRIPEPVDPVTLARDEGRREMALQLLALMQVTPFELSQMMESDDEA